MPSTSISVYILKVVSGLRSSWVTEETKSARRWLSDIAPISRTPTEKMATAMQTHAILREKSIGEPSSTTPPGTRPGTSLSGSDASVRPSAGSNGPRSGISSDPGKRSSMLASRADRTLNQSIQQP